VHAHPAGPRLAVFLAGRVARTSSRCANTRVASWIRQPDLETWPATVNSAQFSAPARHRRPPSVTSTVSESPGESPSRSAIHLLPTMMRPEPAVRSASCPWVMAWASSVALAGGPPGSIATQQHRQHLGGGARRVPAAPHRAPRRQPPRTPQQPWRRGAPASFRDPGCGRRAPAGRPRGRAASHGAPGALSDSSRVGATRPRNRSSPTRITMRAATPHAHPRRATPR